MRRPPSRVQQEALVRRWNERHAVGTPVIVRTDARGEVATVTRSPAQLLSGHTAVVWVEGMSACYVLDRVRPAGRALEAAEALERR